MADPRAKCRLKYLFLPNLANNSKLKYSDKQKRRSALKGKGCQVMLSFDGQVVKMIW
jgi:hypothetical protein